MPDETTTTTTTSSSTTTTAVTTTTTTTSTTSTTTFILEILTTDTINTGREKINQNFSVLSFSYTSHISAINPHNTTLSSIDYVPVTYSGELNTVQTAENGLNYTLTSLNSHIQNISNPHLVTAAQLLDVTQNSLTVGNTITNVASVINGLTGFKYLYNVTESLKSGNAINLNFSDVEPLPSYNSTNLKDLLVEIDTDFTKSNRAETILDTWVFGDGLISNQIDVDNLYVNNIFLFDNGNTNVFLDQSETSIDTNIFNLDAADINISTNNYSLNVDQVATINLTGSQITFNGVSSAGNYSSYVNINDNTKIDISANKTLYFSGTSGSKIIFDTPAKIDFNGVPRALYSSDLQLAAGANDFITRRYLDENYLNQIFAENVFLSSSAPYINLTNNVKAALEELSGTLSNINTLPSNTKLSYSYSLVPIGTEFLIEDGNSEVFITLPVTLPPYSLLYYNSLSYILPVGIDVTLSLRGYASNYVFINQALGVSAVDSNHYYRTDYENYLLINNSTSNAVTYLVDIIVSNTSGSTKYVDSGSSLGFAFFSVFDPTYTTTTTSTSTTTTPFE